MSLHFDKLHCGPRALLLMAEKTGVPMHPDEVWRRFEAVLSSDKEAPGGTHFSTLLDIARSFGLAEHIGLTHELSMVAANLPNPAVRGVLVSWERAPIRADREGPSEIAPHRHIARLNRCVPMDGSEGRYCGIEVESPRWPGGPDMLFLHVRTLEKMMAAFWIFYRQ